MLGSAHELLALLAFGPVAVLPLLQAQLVDAPDRLSDHTAAVDRPSQHVRARVGRTTEIFLFYY